MRSALKGEHNGYSTVLREHYGYSLVLWENNEYSTVLWEHYGYSTVLWEGTMRLPAATAEYSAGTTGGLACAPGEHGCTDDE